MFWVLISTKIVKRNEKIKSFLMTLNGMRAFSPEWQSQSSDCSLQKKDDSINCRLNFA